tara:strand:- start:229 stop:411 length:183 start_codon:yes stop_codon:yes gene_type:complete
MSPKQRHSKSQSTITHEELYAFNEQPTNATFISTETMETNAEKESVRQKSKVVYDESRLA